MKKQKMLAVLLSLCIASANTMIIENDAHAEDIVYGEETVEIISE